MQDKIKENIIFFTKQKGITVRKLERDAGLSDRFLNNFLLSKAQRSLSIDAVVKIATALNLTIDQLVGLSSEKNLDEMPITRRDIFSSTCVYVIDAKHNEPFKLGKIVKAIYEIYLFSLKKGAFDQEFADWFINNQL